MEPRMIDVINKIKSNTELAEKLTADVVALKRQVTESIIEQAKAADLNYDELIDELSMHINAAGGFS